MLRRLLRFFFRLLYHELAWLYDLVAGMVSLGRWNDWIRSVMPFVEGPRILEVAYGTGILQKAMRQQPGFVTGIDESRQMAGIARRRLEGLGDARCALVRGRAQSLPYCRQAFDTVVATFPTEFVVDPDVLREVHRVLGASGKLVVLAAAWIRGTTLLERAAAWLFKSTHQSPASLPASAAAEFVQPLEDAGFRANVHLVGPEGSTILILVASR